MIMRWTVASLMRSRKRAFGSTIAIAAALVPLITFRAVWEGETRQLAVYLEKAGADVWVMQDDVANMHMASSFISEGKRNEVAGVEGVRAVSGILYLNTMLSVGDREWFTYVVGIDEPNQLGGPWLVPVGRSSVEPGEAIIPETLARIGGVGIGDVVSIADRILSIVGLSAETFSATNPVVLVHALHLSGLLSLAGYDSYFLVLAESGVVPLELARSIANEVDDVDALPTAAFVENDLQLTRQMGAEVIALMTLLSAVLAALIVAFALYIHTSHSRHELAVLKALGFESRHLYGSVLFQAVLLTTAAVAVALIAAVGLAWIGPKIAPILRLSLTATHVAQTAAAALAIGVAASLTLAGRVAKVDPASAFAA